MNLLATPVHICGAQERPGHLNNIFSPESIVNILKKECAQLTILLQFFGGFFSIPSSLTFSPDTRSASSPILHIHGQCR